MGWGWNTASYPVYNHLYAGDSTLEIADNCCAQPDLMQHPPLWRPPCKWNVATQPLKRKLGEWVGGCRLSLMSGCCFMQVTVEGSWLLTDYLHSLAEKKWSSLFHTSSSPKTSKFIQRSSLVLLGTSLTMESRPEGALFTGAPISSASPKCIQQHHLGRIL